MNKYNTLNEQVERLSSLMKPINEGTTGKAPRLNEPEKRKVNNQLHHLMKPTYFDDIPLDSIFKLLKANGLVPIMEDGTEWEGMLIGASSHAMIELGYLNQGTLGNNEIMTYVPIENAGLSISWHKMGSGRWEVLAYIS
jgi:hypothetical protein